MLYFIRFLIAIAMVCFLYLGYMDNPIYFMGIVVCAIGFLALNKFWRQDMEYLIYLIIFFSFTFTAIAIGMKISGKK